MSDRSAIQGVDELLLPFLHATDDAESQQFLTQLISAHADPVIKSIIRNKLHVSVNRAGEQPGGPEAEDVYGEILLQLVARLREFKTDPGEKAIRNFSNYVAVITYNGCNEFLRQKYPQRHSLRNKLRYILNHQKGFALWQREDRQWLCGFAGSPSKPVSTGDACGRLRLLRDNPDELEQAGLSSDSIQRMNLADLLAAIFDYAGGPVELDDLVSLVADLRGIKGQREQLSVHEEGETADQFEQLPSPGANVATEVERRIYLQRLWAEICQLPLRQRVALLLNLTDAEGRDLIALLPLTGTATIRQIAEAVALPAEEFAALWNDLPLDDAAIAGRLGIKRQQVINLRKSGRERLARRMKGY